jgi:O-antigen/teichoic acid export membrane protein
MSAPPTVPTTIPEPDIGGAGGLAARLVRGSAVYAVANFGLKALNFALLPVYTRFLTPADYGTVGLAESVAAVFLVIFGISLEVAVRRYYFEYSSDQDRLTSYLSSVFRFAGVYGAIVLALALAAGPFLLRALLPGFSVPFYPYIALAVGSSAVLNILQYRLALYQVQEKPKSYAWLSFLSFALTAAATLILVAGLRWGAAGMLGGKLMAGAVTGVVSVVLMWRWLSAGFDWKYVRESLPIALPLVPHSLMALGLVLADRFILQHYRSLEEVGVYTLAYTLGMVMYLVTLSTGQAWQPIFFDVARQGPEASNVLARLSAGLFVFWAWIGVFGALIAQDAMRLLDVRYRSAGRVIPWIIGGYLMHGLFGLFHLGAIQSKRTKFILFASATACAINIGLNLLWAPRYGMYGAAYATLGAYAIEAVLMFIYAQRIYPLPYRPLELLGAAGAFAIAIAASQMPWTSPLRPLLLLATFVVSSLLLWLCGGQNLMEDIRLMRRRHAA